LRKAASVEGRQGAILRWLNETGYKVEAEYLGIPKRKFRADYCIPELGLWVEYEGLGYKSRHTSTIGYTNDCRKYNLAAINGYMVLRYTSVSYKEAEHEIKEAVKMLAAKKKADGKHTE
jgi:hypothetical protein